MKVFILLWCRSEQNFFGTTLVFDTVRTGFPGADIFVFDNASQYRHGLKEKALAAGAHFTQLEAGIFHHDFLKKIIEQEDGEIVFLDPDVIFWEKVEDWKFNALAAGRMLPGFNDSFSGTKTYSRLHTSFLWIPDAKKLKEQLHPVKACVADEQVDLITPCIFPVAGKWYRLDTFAGFCNAHPDKIYAFKENELKAYDHLFCGTHLDIVNIPYLNQIHAMAKKDPKSVRGIWKAQERFFAV